MPLDRRLAGVLLHPTSLPGPFGIGDIGPAAHRFLDWVAEAGLGYWQILPLGPTSFGDSPYQCFSANAGNPYLVSPELLVQAGLLDAADIEPPHFRGPRVDYGAVIPWKMGILRKAYDRYKAKPDAKLKARYEAWAKKDTVTHWLEDFALFMALKQAHDYQSWNTWAPELRAFDKKAVKKAAQDHADVIEYHRFIQFLFFDQWAHLRAAAKAKHVEIIGDAPIYVAYDSADTWANQKLFQLDDSGNPTAVAGVPPDYFSEDGQLWGNPLYDWAAMAKAKYAWWVKRMETAFDTVDVVRLDHFRGFMGYWSVPAGQKTARHGKWIKGPGGKLFAALEAALGKRPIIAEDLGEITSDVREVMDQFQLPGMKVLQFAWGVANPEPLIPDPNSGFLPHECTPNTVVYTGTHDNETTVGWYTREAKPINHHLFRTYLGTDGSMPHWDLIRAGMRTSANTFVAPMQDFLGVGSEGRMNLPGSADGNWGWRMAPDAATPKLAAVIRQLAYLTQRHNNPPKGAVAKPLPKPTY